MQFQKLTTPSRKEAAQRILNINESILKNSDFSDQHLNFSLNYSQFVANNLQKGFNLTINKCHNCNYNIFKHENLNQTRCFKCEFNDVNKNEEIFNLKLKKFCVSINHIQSFCKESTKLKKPHFEPFQKK